jgi:hypothetical protein
MVVELVKKLPDSIEPKTLSLCFQKHFLFDKS